MALSIPEAAFEAGQIHQPFSEEMDLSPLLEQIKNSRIVMLGEATHGTEEFYFWRRKISARLIEEMGFDFIATEGDWPDAWRVHNYITHGRGISAETVLRKNHRWPTWMWANTEVVKLVEWIHDLNLDRLDEDRIGFYGLDIYSLFESVELVLDFLRKENPFMAKQFEKRYACFDPFMRNEISYAKHTLKSKHSCEDAVVENLIRLLNLRISPNESESFFNAKLNAQLVRDAERYYRTMVRSEIDSWNIRDEHMMSTLDALLEKHGPNSKGIVWAHNTHVGDYRATNMALIGEKNLGGLARQKYGKDAVSLVGFGTYQGSVIASHAWDANYELLKVPPAKTGSYEEAFHILCKRQDIEQFFLLLNSGQEILNRAQGHRAIGVLYDPQFEQYGNYVPTILSKRYDAFVFIDTTHALTPLHVQYEHQQIPQTWPGGC